MFKRVLLSAVLLAAATAVYANPDYSQDIWYYDSQGNNIGWYTIDCNGQHYSGGSTSDDYEVVTIPCQSWVPWMSCNDQGLNTLSGCENWCYSAGYVMSYNYDMVSKCDGICKFNEGPGNPPNSGLYCPTCWKNTGSCPTAFRPKRPQRPTLTAALDAKMWEILTHLR